MEGYVTMVMYSKVVHQKAWKEIKNSKAVMSYLQQNHVFMFIDQFNAWKVGTPGFVMKIHPKNYNMKKLRGLLELEMRLVDCNKEEMVIKWKESTSAEDLKAAITDSHQLARIKEKKENLLPTCCAAEDAPYMKTLLSAAYEQKLIKLGLFVPQGLFRMAGEGAYKYHLRSHNEYINNTTLVAVVGLHRDAMKSKIVNDGKEMTLEYYLNKGNAVIESVEETPKTEEEDFTLLVIFDEHIVDADKMIGYDHPWHHHNSGNKTIGSYAASLQRQYEPNGSYQKTAYNKCFDTLSLKYPNKHIMNDPPPQNQTPPENSDIPTKEDRAETEARFQQKLDELEVQMQKKIRTLREDIEKVQETRNIQMMEIMKEMLRNQTVATNEAIDKAVEEQGTMMKNMLILEQSHTDSKFDQVLQLLQAQANMNQYQMNYQQSQQLMTLPPQTTPEKMMMAQQMGSQGLQSSQGSIISQA
eukprot:8539612-Ditylum_brightwellii.AAC.1